MDALKVGLQNIHCQLMEDNGTCLPLSPSKQIYGINVQICSYFPSFTLPLKINFISCDNVLSPAIFKVFNLYNNIFRILSNMQKYNNYVYHRLVMICSKIC